MSDNVELNAGAGGDTIAADEIAGVKYQRVKLIVGANNTNDGDVCTTNPMPISDAGGAITVDGTVAVTQGTATSLKAQAEQYVGGTAVSNSNPVPVSDAGGALTVDNGGTFAVQVSSALPAGTNAIGKLAANDGVDIGDVTINNASLTVAGTVTANAGIGPFPVSDNSGSLTVDAPVASPVYVRLSDGSSAIATLPVSVATIPSHAVTNAGTFAVQVDGAALTSLQLIDDGIATTGSAITAKGMAAVGTDGTNARVIKTDSSGELQVDVLTMPAVTNSGTFAVQAAGDVAHDASDSGSPVKNGFKATTALSGLTLVASGDRTDGFAGVDGVQIVRPHCNLEDIVSGVASITDGSSTSVIAAQGSGVKVYITSVIIANTSATAVTVDIRDGAAGTVKATFPVPANTSGVVCNLPVPIGFSANTAVCADPSASASTITVSLAGFKSKV